MIVLSSSVYADRDEAYLSEETRSSATHELGIGGRTCRLRHGQAIVVVVLAFLEAQHRRRSRGGRDAAELVPLAARHEQVLVLAEVAKAVDESKQLDLERNLRGALAA